MENKRFSKHVDLRKPDFILELSSLVDYLQVKTYIQKILNMDNYVYAFQLGNIPDSLDEIINIGMSVDDTDCRVYRKCGHIPGWGVRELTGKSGRDMRTIVIPRVEDKHKNVTVHKNDIKILFWDTTHIPQKRYGQCVTVEAEKQLFHDYDMMYTGKPIGNIQDPRKRNISFGPDLDMFDKLFDNT